MDARVAFDPQARRDDLEKRGRAVSRDTYFFGHEKSTMTHRLYSGGLSLGDGVHRGQMAASGHERKSVMVPAMSASTGTSDIPTKKADIDSSHVCLWGCSGHELGLP